MSWYAVYLESCPQCSGSHHFGGHQRIDNGPSDAGTLASLHPRGNDPPYILGEWIVECEEAVLTCAATTRRR